MIEMVLYCQKFGQQIVWILCQSPPLFSKHCKIEIIKVTKAPLVDSSFIFFFTPLETTNNFIYFFV